MQGRQVSQRGAAGESGSCGGSPGLLQAGFEVSRGQQAGGALQQSLPVGPLCRLGQGSQRRLSSPHPGAERLQRGVVAFGEFLHELLVGHGAQAAGKGRRGQQVLLPPAQVVGETAALLEARQLPDREPGKLSP